MMTNLHLNFRGNCREAFAFYETVFDSKVRMTMTYGDAPDPVPVPREALDLVMHTAIPLGNTVLMGCDTPPGREQAMSGFQVAVEMPDEDGVRRVYEALRADGSVQMPLGPTFWSPLFGMCTDRFGVGWMVSAPEPHAA